VLNDVEHLVALRQLKDRCECIRAELMRLLAAAPVNCNEILIKPPANDHASDSVPSKPVARPGVR
jgi:hypothetical protein